MGRPIPLVFAPVAIAFDGNKFMWVVDRDGSSVTRFHVSDGSLAGTFSVGLHPNAIASDGSNVYVADDNSTVTKLRTSDGAVQGTFTSTNGGKSIAFDGSSPIARRGGCRFASAWGSSRACAPPCSTRTSVSSCIATSRPATSW